MEKYAKEKRGIGKRLAISKATMLLAGVITLTALLITALPAKYRLAPALSISPNLQQSSTFQVIRKFWKDNSNHSAGKGKIPSRVFFPHKTMMSLSRPMATPEQGGNIFPLGNFFPSGNIFPLGNIIPALSLLLNIFQ